MITGLMQWLGPRDKQHFRGGIALLRDKPGIPSDGVIRDLETPEHISIPLLDFQREVLEPIVKTGDKVSVGDEIARGIFASCAGIVIDIAPKRIAHPSSLKVPCVLIQTEHSHLGETKPKYIEQTEISLERVINCGIHGLGGAGFNTAKKFEHSIGNGIQLDTLIVNAIECEPLISCDESLIVSDSVSVINAIQKLIQFTNCRRCILAIEDDKELAIAALREALSQQRNPLDIELILLAPVYPAGAEKPLVERLTGIKIPINTYPVDFGIVCVNVSTAVAIENSRKGFPQISRIVTVAGELAENPVNVSVAFGTSVADVLTQTDNNRHISSAQIRIGGPLSGFTIDDLSVPITATTNSIVVEPIDNPVQQHPCIRCSACSDVCPVDLLPQQLFQLSSNSNAKQAEESGVQSCIECACCDLVCPSNIPLTQSFRFLKGHIKEQKRAEVLAKTAETRYQNRENRQIARSELKAKKREEAKQRLATQADPLADALARARQRRKKKSSSKPINNGSNTTLGKDAENSDEDSQQ